MPTHPLDRFPAARTHDPDEMRDVVMRICGGRRFELPDGPTEFAAHANHCALRDIVLSYCNYAAPVAIEFPEAPLVRQQFCLRGSGQVRFGSAAYAVSSREACVLPADAVIAADFGAAFEQIVLRIHASALTTRAASLLGGEPAAELRFDPEADADGDEALRLRRTVSFVVAELDSGEAQVPDAALAEYEDLLITQFLLANRNSFSDLLGRPARSAAPWQVRLVEEFVAANWAKPITIEALAAVTGASARSIFKAFKASRGCSPMAFVRSVRMTKARETLVRADASTTVMGVALACGFQNTGRFSAAYRRSFGEWPSDTLRRAKMHGREAGVRA